MLVVAAAGVAVTVAAPESATVWVGATAAAGGACVAVLTAALAWIVRRNAKRGAAARVELVQLRGHAAHASAEGAEFMNVTLPAVAKRLCDGVSADLALAEVRRPSDPQLHSLLGQFAVLLADAEQRAAAGVSERMAVDEELALLIAQLRELVDTGLPDVIERLHQGASAESVLMEAGRPADVRLRRLLETVVAEFATSERRSRAAMAASAKGLSRVQASATTILADLREMQQRYGQDNEEVFGDLLKLDHSTSQLGLLTDRLALLVGGRASRAWPKPIKMESVLRGAVGRIAAYRRVRLHSTSSAAIAGYAAEGVMHLLAELMDNATRFSPPIDEVHVYAEERMAGIVVTIEGGLQMSDGALRRAEEAVSGRITDLAALQGTRLGLAVVGTLARKFDVSVTYRPSSRGGTGAVVLIPQQLLAHRGTGSAAGPTGALAAPDAGGTVRDIAATRTETETQSETEAETMADVRLDSDAWPGAASEAPGEEPAAETTGEQTLGDLPQRPRGATLAAASHGRARTEPRPAAPKRSPEDIGNRFSAFRQASQSAGQDRSPADDPADPPSAEQPPPPQG